VHAGYDLFKINHTYCSRRYSSNTALSRWAGAHIGDEKARRVGPVRATPPRTRLAVEQTSKVERVLDADIMIIVSFANFETRCLMCWRVVDVSVVEFGRLMSLVSVGTFDATDLEAVLIFPKNFKYRTAEVRK